jgi:hypothetical protein
MEWPLAESVAVKHCEQLESVGNAPFPEVKGRHNGLGLGNAVDCSSVFGDNSWKSAGIGVAQIRHSSTSICIRINPEEAEFRWNNTTGDFFVVVETKITSDL